jgi:phosphoglycolate phosphatase
VNPPLPPFDSVVFDLDGTLWDPCRPVAIGWNNVVRANGIDFREITPADIRQIAGKPHDECIREIFVGLPEAQLRILIEGTMEEDNRVMAELGGDLYPGVGEGLRELALRMPLFIVSNCQAGYIEVFQRVHGFEGVFTDWECWGKTGRPKGENLAMLIERNRLTAPIMVGDAAGDELAAEQCGVPFVWAVYGFGDCEQPEWSVESFSELLKMLRHGELNEAE